MYNERMFFPTKGRIEQRVARRRQAGLFFKGMLWSRRWGPLCQLLVYERSATTAQHRESGVPADVLIGGRQVRPLRLRAVHTSQLHLQ